MAPLAIATLIEDSEKLFGVPSYLAAGALNERTGLLEPADALAIISAWLQRPITPPDPLPPSSIPEGWVNAITGGQARWSNPDELGSWRGPVATVAQLPSTGNRTGHVRLVLASMSLYGWTGTTWAALAGSGGGVIGDYIDIPWDPTGLDAGEGLLWDNVDARFEAGVI